MSSQNLGSLIGDAALPPAVHWIAPESLSLTHDAFVAYGEFRELKGDGKQTVQLSHADHPDLSAAIEVPTTGDLLQRVDHVSDGQTTGESHFSRYSGERTYDRADTYRPIVREDEIEVADGPTVEKTGSIHIDAKAGE